MAVPTFPRTLSRSREVKNMSQSLSNSPRLNCMGTDLERFKRFIMPEPNSGCWLWIGGIKANGYGVFRPSLSRRSMNAHRVAYQLFKGPIPTESIDHKCRVRCCVNPDHLEAVTQRENVLRGVSIPALNAAKTSCHKGHAFTPENTWFEKNKGRHCRECHRLTEAARRDRLRAQGLWPPRKTP